jgi:colanic acid/amylovoran biosynthesis glycosyltransferase
MDSREERAGAGVEGPAGWALPEGPWVLHSTPELGNLTERWIDIQVQAHTALGARLLGNALADGATRRPYHLMATDRLDVRLGYGLMMHTRGHSMRALKRALAPNPPVALHVHFGLYGAAHAPLAKALGVPLVVSFYGADATMKSLLASRTWRRRYARMFAAGDAFLAEGPAMAERIAALGCPREKLHVVRLPADADGLRELATERPDGLLVGMAGRFCEKKGFDVGIRAFAAALGGRDDARLLMVGGGELEPELRRLVAESGIAEQTTFAGRLPFGEFMTRLGGCSLALHPSRTAADGDSEGGAPVTLIESQWLGVPAIVSDHDDLSFVSAPDGSVTLPPLDADAWAGTLSALADDPARLAAMAAASSRFAREHHSPAANAAAREAIYRA